MGSDDHFDAISAKIRNTIKDGPPGHITPEVLADVLLGLAEATIRTGQFVAGGVDKTAFELMERMDRLQDEQTKQRIEMEAAVQLLRDTAPTELLVRIRQLQDEIRELKEQKDRPPT